MNRKYKSAAVDDYDMGGYEPIAPPQNKAISIAEVLGRFASIALVIVTLPVRLFAWTTRAPGSALWYGLFAGIFILANAEGYWQSLGGIVDISRAAFIPKFGIDDGADLNNIWIAFRDPGFWFAFAFSTLIQTGQAKTMRDSIADARKEYEKVANEYAPPEQEGLIDLAKYRRKRVVRAGMRRLKQNGFLIFFSYAIDISIALYNYPLWALASLAKFLINFVWAIGNVIGSEILIGQFDEAISHLKIRPKVEVLR